MSAPSKRSLWHELRFFFIFIVILCFLFEMVSSIIFSYKYGGNKLAVVQTFEKFVNTSPDLSLYHKVHNLVRPDSTQTTSRRIADEIWEANKYSYEPWLQFRVKDYQSKYVNISGFERTCIPNKFINRAYKDTLEVYFFGGSTMYGYNVSDAETIPSQFLDLYRKKYPSGMSVRVRNFGIPYYYSKQELLLFSKLIFEGHKPAVAIFLDGLNDFYPSRMLYYDKPHFSYAMQQVFDDQLFLKTRRTIVDSSEQFYIDPPGIRPADYYNQLMNKYVSNIRQANRLSEKAGIKSFFFCQPVPFYNYPNRSNDPISYKVNYDRYDHIYPILEKNEAALPNFTFLANMLSNEKGMPFVDQVHYSPAFSKKIAEQILLKVEAHLNVNALSYGK